MLLSVVLVLVTLSPVVISSQNFPNNSDGIVSNDVAHVRTLRGHRNLANNTVSTISHRKKRLFAPLPAGAAFILTPKFTMPIPGLAPGGSELHVEVPLSFNLPTMASEATAARHTGDSDHLDTYSYYRRASDDKMHLYNYAEGVISRFGLNGRQCMLRTICEIAEAPVENAGVLGEVVNTLLRSTVEPGEFSKSSEMLDYVKAERLGKMYGQCQHYYSACPLSFFNLV